MMIILFFAVGYVPSGLNPLGTFYPPSRYDRLGGRSHLFYTLLAFGGRQPLCGMGVTSTISVTSIPEPWMVLIADSRPFPGPFT